jgi:hypothetical protein
MGWRVKDMEKQDDQPVMRGVFKDRICREFLALIPK